MPRPAPVPWSEATQRALYGPDGFFRRPEGPAAHFRTSVHASPLYARAVVRLLDEVDAALGRPARLDLVDVGAGRGELLVDVLATVPASTRDRLRLHAVEIGPRPSSLPAEVAWTAELPDAVVGLLLANEWLDDVPVDVVEADGQALRLLLVDPATGEERRGTTVGPPDAEWLARWWPVPPAEAGARAEVGRSRDEAWAAAVRRVERGVALAVDYGHLAPERSAGAWAAGTLVGYRDGRVVAPVPDGSCDLTAHVAVDACAAAGERAGAERTVLVRQREALRALGVSGRPPAPSAAAADPRAYAAGLRAAAEAAELVDPAGLGGFWWLLQSVGVPLPAPWAGVGGDGQSSATSRSTSGSSVAS